MRVLQLMLQLLGVRLDVAPQAAVLVRGRDGGLRKCLLRKSSALAQKGMPPKKEKIDAWAILPRGERRGWARRSPM